MQARYSPAVPTRSPKKGKKYFSVSEANRAMPYLQRIVGEITQCYKQAVEVRELIEDDETTRDQDTLRGE